MIHYFEAKCVHYLVASVKVSTAKADWGEEILNDSFVTLDGRRVRGKLRASA